MLIMLQVFGFASSVGSPTTGYISQIGQISGTQDVDVEKYTTAHIADTPITFVQSNVPPDYVVTGEFANGNIISQFNYGPIAISSDTSYTSGYYGIRAWNSNDLVQWWRLRAYPPKGTMPTVSYGTLVTGYYTFSFWTYFNPAVPTSQTILFVGTG